MSSAETVDPAARSGNDAVDIAESDSFSDGYHSQYRVGPAAPPALLTRSRGRTGERALAALPLACIVVSIATLALPVALTHMPPLLDFPNHLARMWLLAGGADHAPLDSIYGVDWSGASTNIGIDLLAATVGRFTGGWSLAMLLLGAAALLPPLGAVLLNRAIFGGWHWWQAGFAVLAWNSTMLAGFLNFQLGIGLGLLAAAADPAVLRRVGPWGTAVVRIALGTILLLFHPFAAGFYAVLLAGLVFGPGKPVGGAAPLARRAWNAIQAAGLAVGIPVACLVLLAPRLPGGHAPPGVYDLWAGYTVTNKITTLLTAIATYDLRVDVAAVLFLWVAIRIMAPRKVLQCHAGLIVGAGGLVFLAIVVPSTLGGTAFVDWRFPIMAILTGVAAIRPDMRSVRSGSLMALALMLVAVTRTAWIGEVWHERQADVAAVEDVLAFVPAGAAVLPVQHLGAKNAIVPRGRILVSGRPTFWHLPALAVPLRHAFVPTLFTAPGKQPLRVLPPWADISVMEGQPVPVAFLSGGVLTVQAAYQVGYVAHWRERFGYMLVINAQEPDKDDESSLPGLEMLADRGYARLYRITPGDTPTHSTTSGIVRSAAENVQLP
jgi:hypothetical protein